MPPHVAVYGGKYLVIFGKYLQLMGLVKSNKLCNLDQRLQELKEMPTHTDWGLQFCMGNGILIFVT